MSPQQAALRTTVAVSHRDLEGMIERRMSELVDLIGFTKARKALRDIEAKVAKQHRRQATAEGWVV